MGPTSAAEPRQRWRLTLARDAQPAERAAADAWPTVLRAAGLPIAWTEGARPRPRVTLGSPLPSGMASRGELVEVTLTERWPVWRVRTSIADHLPDGWHLVDLEDVWVGAPALPGRISAADYRVDVDGSVTAERLAVGCAALLAASSLPRARPKGDRTIEYDLRPLLLDIAAPGDDVVWMRTRIHPELGSGRPEEVVAALADSVGVPLSIRSVVRERLVLGQDLE